GQNASAIAAAEAHYSQMWAQDATAMYGYAASSAPAAQLTPFTPPPRTADPAGQATQAAANTHNAGNLVGSGVQTALSQLTPATSNVSMQAVPTAAAVAAPIDDVVALPSLADLGGVSAVSTIGLILAGAAASSADQSTREILKEQNQLYGVQNDILAAIDLFSPLTPSRPEGFVSGIPSASMSAAMGEAVSAGNLSVPISWAEAAPEIRTLSYAAPLAGPAGGAAPAASIGAAGTAFSQMAMAGMGGSALAGSVSRDRQGAAVTAPPGQRLVEPAQEPPENPVTGIAAEIREFAELRDRGLITRDEYNEQKLRLLGQ
ncbi:MAG: PPE domain-containing protein, partial [Mycobacterium sp.]